MIIDTIPVSHDVSPYVQLLDVEGALVIVGNLGNMAGYGTPAYYRLTVGRYCRNPGNAGFLRQARDSVYGAFRYP